MQLSLNTEGPVDVVVVEEARIDAAVAIAFKDAIRSVTTGNDGPVVLDLERVEFIDSSGLGAVVAARKLLAARELELAALQRPVRSVMELTRMDSVFVIHDSRAAAYSAHGSAPAA